MLAFLFLRLKNNIEKTLCTSNSFFCLFFFAIISAICVCEKRKEQKKTRKSHRLSNFCVFVIRFENSVCWRLPYYSILSMLCSFLFIFMFRILNFFFFCLISRRSFQLYSMRFSMWFWAVCGHSSDSFPIGHSHAASGNHFQQLSPS